MRHLIVEQGIVANVVEAPEGFTIEGQVIIPHETAQIGWLYDGQTFTRPKKPQKTAKNVNAERDKRLHDGASFAVTGIADTIPLQGREADKSVYLAQLMRAQGMKAAGVTDPALRIRDAVNGIHWLTPDQMIELVSQGMAWFEDVMAVSWAMKDATGDFAGGIPDDLSNDAHWPPKEPTE